MQSEKTLLFEQLFYSTKDKVYAFIKGMVHDHVQVQDYMQSCYMRLWEHLDTLSTDTEVLPFLYTVSRNIVIDHLRKNIRTEYTEDILHFAEETQGHNSTEYYIAERESSRQIRELLSMLPERRRQVFVLIKIEGLSYKEVANHLKISVSTVEKHMHEAYKAIAASRVSEAFICLLVASHFS